VVYLIGVPAVGKYTIAREISRLTGARLVDNQLINLPVFSVLGYDGKDSFPFPRGAWKHIETIREVVQVPHPDALRFDTSEESVETIANHIIGHVQRVQRK
jgi:adenylylsulfate kinase-like enzyme